jgi:hypothetical protein
MQLAARTLLAALLLSSSTSLVIGCSSSDSDSGSNAPAASDTQDVTSSRDIAATTKEEHAALGSMWHVRKVANDKVSLFLYETGGGDPAMNGNVLYLGAFGEHGAGGVFDLGINIVEVKKAEMAGPDTIKITGIRDTMGDDGNIKPGQPFEATVKITVKDGDEGIAVEKKVTVTQPGEAAKTVDATTEQRWDFMGSVYKMTNAQDENVVFRLFERSGGDPAMNGVELFASIGIEMESNEFDLGLNLAGVTKVSFKSATEVRIEALEDQMGADGIPHPKPVFYSVKYTVSDRVGDKIKLTKLAR